MNKSGVPASVQNTVSERGNKMDIKATAEQLVKKIQGDDSLLKAFKSKPEDTVKKLVNKDLKGDILKQLVDLVKAKLGLDGIAGIANKIGGLFGKKD